MERARSDGPAWVPELELPDALREKCARMQAEARYYGRGFRKERLDRRLHERLAAHFHANVARFRAEHAIEEIGSVARNTIPALIFEDASFNAQLAQDLKPLTEAWAGMALATSACYGIRCYQRGVYLHNHVDRAPHVFSATVCVEHALDSPWPLHIEDVDGNASQVHMEPGEFVFYEGMRLAHGRPYPLDGEFYAGVFIHFYPAGEAPR
jgi:prolyl 4-hydroxylase